MATTSQSSDSLWSPDHPVLTVLRERRSTASMPGGRSDGFKVGLAVEGGGMRGVVSGAMLAALDEFGFGSAFDTVYGCSAGAIGGAYFVAGQAWKALPIYYEDLPRSRLLRVGRLARGRSILDLGIIFDEIMERRRPLDYARVLASPISLSVAITLVDEIKPHEITRFATPAQLKDALVASSWRPVLVRGTANHDGRRAIDGAVLTAMPYRSAVADGCTHVLSLSTFPSGGYSEKPSFFVKLTARHVERLRHGMGKAYLEETKRKFHQIQWLDAQRRIDGGEGRGPHVLDLAPLSGDATISRWEMRTLPLMTAIARSYELVYAAVEGRPSQVLSDGSFYSAPRWTIIHDSPSPVPPPDAS